MQFAYRTFCLTAAWQTTSTHLEQSLCFRQSVPAGGAFFGKHHQYDDGVAVWISCQGLSDVFRTVWMGYMQGKPTNAPSLER